MHHLCPRQKWSTLGKEPLVADSGGKAAAWQLSSYRGTAGLVARPLQPVTPVTAVASTVSLPTTAGMGVTRAPLALTVILEASRMNLPATADTAVVRAPLALTVTAAAAVRTLLASATLTTAVVMPVAYGQVVMRLAKGVTRLRVRLLPVKT